MIQKILFIGLGILFPFTTTEAQSVYEGFYITFYSECCGINKDANTALENLEKKYNKVFQKEVIYWGKEGEKVVLYTSKDLNSPVFQDFFKKVNQNITNKYKLVKVNAFFEYETEKSVFWVHIPPFGLIADREIQWKTYCKTFETDHKTELLKGSMINETHIEQDQDKRYQIDISKLTESQRRDFILQSKKILVKTP
jgi:thiol-disulfide isomerase/thioredoxin